MERLSDSDHPLVRETALRLTEGSLEVRDKLLKLFLYVRDGIVFRFPENGDFVKASETIRLGYGQCNTKATLLLALCKSIALPARIHFSLIKRDIQKGFFTGIAFWLMPREISHSWIEVGIDSQWRRIDTFINALALYEAALIELKRRHWSTGFSLALSDEEVSADLNLDREVYQQMAAVTGDHGTWPDPADYYASPNYRNRPGPLRLWVYRRLIGGINQRVAQLRGECVAKAADV